jgi:hypothetical protein
MARLSSPLDTRPTPQKPRSKASRNAIAKTKARRGLGSSALAVGGPAGRSHARPIPISRRIETTRRTPATAADGVDLPGTAGATARLAPARSSRGPGESP